MTRRQTQADREREEREANPPTSEGRVPPHDLDAEAAVLSALLLDGGRIEAIDWLRPEHFYSEAHRRIYEAARALKLAGKASTIDAVTVGDELKLRERLHQVGGAAYLVQIMDSAPVIANIAEYATIVYERWRARQTVLRCQRVAAAGYGDYGPVQEYIDGAIAALATLANDSPTASLVAAGKLAEAQVEQMVTSSRMTQDQARERTVGIPTGIREFDRMTGGMALRAKTTLMAPSGGGKSTLGLQFAIHNSGFRKLTEPLADVRCSVLFFTGEMTKEEQADRLTGYMTRIDSRRIAAARVKPTLTLEEWERVRLAKRLQQEMGLYFSERSDLTLEYVSASVRQAMERAPRSRPVKLVVLDYVQRMKAPAKMDRDGDEAKVKHNTQGLTELAKATGVALLELAQMNNPDPKVSASGKPYLYLAKYCKAIEIEANQVWVAWAYDKADADARRLTVTKGRNGSEGEQIDLVTEKEYGRFYDPAWENFTPAFEGII